MTPVAVQGGFKSVDLSTRLKHKTPGCPKAPGYPKAPVSTNVPSFVMLLF